jgi:hypothetical protein
MYKVFLDKMFSLGTTTPRVSFFIKVISELGGK